jgi:hypothetical protein
MKWDHTSTVVPEALIYTDSWIRKAIEIFAIRNIAALVENISVVRRYLKAMYTKGGFRMMNLENWN